MRSSRFLLAAVLLLGCGWSSEPRLPLYRGMPVVHAAPVRDVPARVGRLRYLGGLHFWSADPAFGGYSALLVRGRRMTMLSDGGLTFDVTVGPGLKASTPRFGSLPGGPGTGWRKLDRDSESLAIDPRLGKLWVGFEFHNAIARYAPDFARMEAIVRPPAMRRWGLNSGAEAMVRLRSGQFLVIGEKARLRRGGVMGLRFPGDPTDGQVPDRFALLTPNGYDPTDIAELPDGRLLVLLRRFNVRQGFGSKLMLVDAAAIRPGGRVGGRVIATLTSPGVHDNFEGVAAVRENGATVIWLLSDDNNLWGYQRTLLLKFRLDA